LKGESGPPAGYSKTTKKKTYTDISWFNPISTELLASAVAEKQTWQVFTLVAAAAEC